MKHAFVALLIVLFAIFAVACDGKEDNDTSPPVAYCCYQQPLEQAPDPNALAAGDEVYRVSLMQKTYYWVRPADSNSALPGGAVLVRKVPK